MRIVDLRADLVFFDHFHGDLMVKLASDLSVKWNILDLVFLMVILQTSILNGEFQKLVEVNRTNIGDLTFFP